MRYAICLEEMEGRWIAHVPALPGCYASADDREAAQAQTPPAIRDYLAWRRSRGDETPSLDASIEITIDEIVRERPHPAEPENTVNAFFCGRRAAAHQSGHRAGAATARMGPRGIVRRDRRLIA